VVAERHDIGAGVQQLVGELAGDPGPVGDVLAVDDADVGVVFLAQRRKTLLDRPPPRDAEDVGDEKGSQLRTSAVAGRSSIDTWFPASFVYRASA
jgi:hypothetical protein